MLLWYDIGCKVLLWLKRMKRYFPKLKKVTAQYEYYFSLVLHRIYLPWSERHPVKWGLNTKKREESFTVSLTSFPVRIGYVHIAIDTMMRQSFKPDRIVLWLAENQFPDKKLPEKLTALQEKGLTIRFCDDLRSHKKYFYTFQEYPDDHVILVDDDFYYPRDTLKVLYRAHKKHPKDIIAVSGQLITPTVETLPSQWGSPEPRKRWVSQKYVQVYTGAGSLFPAHWYPDEVFSKEKAMALAGTADDLWLKAMSMVAGVKTTLVCPSRAFPALINIKNNESLYFTNNLDGGNQNDIVWKKLVDEYQLHRTEE